MRLHKILILVVVVFFLVACSKNEINKDLFVERANFNGYFLEKSLSGYEKYSYIKELYYAINRDNAYFIQFFELENDEYAKKFYDINKNEIIKEETDLSYVKSKNRSNYAFYHMENDSNYMLVVRAKSNILYLSAPLNYLHEIEEFLSELDIEY